MSEHPGREYLDACFGIQEERRLAYVEEAKRDPLSVWFEAQAARQAPSNRRTSRNRGLSGHRRDALSRTCGCCGRPFVRRRRDARFCGDVCRVRSGRGRCEEVA